MSISPYSVTADDFNNDNVQDIAVVNNSTNTLSKILKKNSVQINSSNVSEFYSACRNGDVNYVKEHLSNLSDTKWNPNQFEITVKSTPLHAASYYGHKEIVELLLQHGCDRTQINGYGLTAYEEAANEEIRQLFKRPLDEFGFNRFQDGTIDNCFVFIDQSKDTIRTSS